MGHIVYSVNVAPIRIDHVALRSVFVSVVYVVAGYSGADCNIHRVRLRESLHMGHLAP
jgi:hypothetical protein